MRRILPLFFFALLLALAAPAQAAPHTERRVALVIGNGAYQHVPPLANPSNDARLMAESLKAIGFEVVGGKAFTDMKTKNDMEQAVRRFGEMIRGGGVGLFFYAGHGVQVDGKNYLIPVAADVAAKTHIKYELVDADYILDEMASSSTSVNVVILDACRNNPFAARGLRAVAPGLASVMAPKGTLVAYSTAPGKTAADGKGRNSPFTSALAKAIRMPGQRIEDVFMRVGAEVEQTTGGEQSPWKSDNLRGVFCLTGQCGTPGAPLAATATADKTAGGSQASAELAFWDTVKSSPNPDDVEAFLAQYPNSELAPAARIRLKQLDRGQEAQQPKAAATCPKSFAGKWTTTYGEMLIRLEGDKAAAVYGYSNRHGELRGTISGGVITGEWVETDLATGNVTGSGPVKLTQSVDGLSFSGTWKGAGLFSGGGAWVGKCHP
jgi:uncharacterized caspase-like protein